MSDAALFGYPLALPDGCEEASTYTFYLEPDGTVARARGAGPSLRPSLIVIRAPQEGRSLDRFMEEQSRAMGTKLPGAKLLREGKLKLGDAPAHEREYQFLPDSPLPGVMQWHVTCAREGWFYLFCATSPKDRYERDKKSFRSVLDSWA